MRGYARQVQRVLLITLALNLMVALGKLAVGLRANSLSVVGDALHSGVDAAANVVALVIIRYSTAPPDEDHPFGHTRYETLAAFVLGGLLFLTAFELGQNALGRLVEPQETLVDGITLAAMAATLVVNVFVATYERREGRRQQSEVLLADSAHTRSDVYVTLAVLAGLLLSRAGFARADAVLALVVAVAIAIAGWRVYRDVLPALTDRAVFDAREVATVVRSVPGVVSVHDIRSRGTRREAYVQMHLVVEKED
ncbi:MAG TPA: cation diffusion facilitator family transporter, partial [Candidatus Thermoplasmatota archaeon]|nr:cation diffusion facilitator family transporter [Candidatus Thermoplasmatota archaeon]